MTSKKNVMSEDTESLVKKVEKLREKKVFSKYITEIYFPCYKNFKEFSRINFDFPLTVLVGKNGSGKSSILHALYGCPKKFSPSYFWFSTATDPIKEKNDKANCFVYSYYKKNKKNKKNISTEQVVYTRSSRPGTKTKRKDPDYWETAKPSEAKYKTTAGKRSTPIEEKLVYLDFRQELSAYDRYFYFGKLTKNNKSKTKQEFIRNVSPKLNNLFHSKDKAKAIYTVRKVPQNKKLIIISDEEIAYISYILGVEYSEIRMITHKFFQIEGKSALVTKKELSYSEANAGSGEYAVINLVHKLMKLPDDTPALVILDEPETSLYPGAQKRLLKFLLKMIITKKCQIVMSTHSEKLTQKLPRTAIKAIHYDESDGQSYIIENCSPATVFEELDIPVQHSNIIVEDEAACILINKVIEKEKFNTLNAIHLSKGADNIKKVNILSDAQEENNFKFYILDGDQSIDKKSLEVGENPSEEELEKIIKKIASNLPLSSSKSRKKGSRNNQEDTIRKEELKKYINFYKNNVYFLPEKTPEDVIYSGNYMKEIIDRLSGSKTNISREKYPQTKDFFHAICEKELGEKCNNEEYYAFIKRATTNFVSNESDSCSYQEIVATLKDIDKKCQANNS